MSKSSGVISILVLSFMLYSCSLPKHEKGIPEPNTPYISSSLFQLFNPTVKAQADNSGILLLRDGARALAERVHLADAAEYSIDAQYYIWNSDKSGQLLMQRLLAAAERGVKVRLLLDDFSVGERNEQLLALNSHKNLQIRVYNPFVMRARLTKWLNFAFDFNRLNRRMHNKTFIVDRMVSIVGGRNIGDEYFNHNEHLNFIDTDILCVGPVQEQVSASFNQYWESQWSVPVDMLINPKSDDSYDDWLNAHLTKNLAEPLDISLIDTPAALQDYYSKLGNELVWAQAVFVADQPGSEDQDAYAKGPKKVAQHLLQLAEESRKEIIVESAYFVLHDDSLELARQLHHENVQISVLTNSMASNDVLPNHSSYAMVREKILDAGIGLHELRPDAPSCIQFIGKQELCDNNTLLGLHAKAAVFDRQTVYVGSMNFNLRSAYLNTEAAMIIKSSTLAEKLSRQIRLNMKKENSWRVYKTSGTVQWVTDISGKEETTTHEPMTSWLERMESGVLQVLPGALYF